jgi:predicted adenine nucleotide alpha hydrolase (AANH) superfamily ATPase
MNKEKILLHICCAPCATESFLRLKEDGLSPIGYFYNPNSLPKIVSMIKEYNECVFLLQKDELQLNKKSDYDYR